MLLGGWIELVCGFLMAFGLLTRIAAFIASGEMAVGYFMFHAPNAFYPIVNKGEFAVALCFIFLFMVFYGPGWLSIDALIARSRGATATATAGGASSANRIAASRPMIRVRPPPAPRPCAASVPHRGLA